MGTSSASLICLRSCDKISCAAMAQCSGQCHALLILSMPSPPNVKPHDVPVWRFCLLGVATVVQWHCAEKKAATHVQQGFLDLKAVSCLPAHDPCLRMNFVVLALQLAPPSCEKTWPEPVLPRAFTFLQSCKSPPEAGLYLGTAHGARCH